MTTQAPPPDAAGEIVVIQADADAALKHLGWPDHGDMVYWGNVNDMRAFEELRLAFARHRLAHAPTDPLRSLSVGEDGDALYDVVAAAGLVKVKLQFVVDSWNKHAAAVEAMNAARPDVVATPAERALYSERYKAAQEAEREMRGSVQHFAKWCAETDATARLGAVTAALSQSNAAQARGFAEEPFQARVQPWMMECFGAEIAADKLERSDRFIEEALELVQACGYTIDRAHALVDYVFGRPVGEPDQEVGGVMVTLAALCLAHDLDMHTAAERELARISAPEIITKIRAKQAAKPTGSALPIALSQGSGSTEGSNRCDVENNATGCLHPDVHNGRCGYSIRRQARPQPHAGGLMIYHFIRDIDGPRMAETAGLGAEPDQRGPKASPEEPPHQTPPKGDD